MNRVAGISVLHSKSEAEASRDIPERWAMRPGSIPRVEELIVLRSGTAVRRDEEGRLLVGSRQVDVESPFALLPVLELHARALPSDVMSALPINEVLAIALRQESGDYWPRLAVDWIARTTVSEEVRAALKEFAHGRLGSQRTRHDARRLRHARPAGEHGPRRRADPECQGSDVGYEDRDQGQPVRRLLLRHPEGSEATFALQLLPVL